ncbi:(deoxy)nucleoside triphosphate pyrophosphohydrolase [Croceicoccus sp. BE223]|uniref:(deoxy)nucleoside triphosphate pyrophosphohydrolase n=1 Tax=Croceicoccus sp. BE223 TaxID=2817716 RepID=UPI00285F92B6|nr:(deoxy)nucleoside triphosphate pyrophosphohydrolase [Croceicoccus sp. BE223]MDR7102921.1 8-oxo-dGTP diphosphatase [Croceicoccus sp. BE223]
MLVVAAALFDGAGRVLLHQRPHDKHHGGLWEFPGGKVEENESPEAALARELAEELGISVDSRAFAPACFTTGPLPRGGDGALVILLYTCTQWRGEPRALEGEAVAWLDLTSCAGMDLAPLDQLLLADLSGRAGR